MKHPKNDAPKSEKKPYVRPQILSRESLEAVAVVCTQPSSKGDPGACPGGPLNS